MRDFRLAPNTRLSFQTEGNASLIFSNHCRRCQIGVLVALAIFLGAYAFYDLPKGNANAEFGFLGLLAAGVFAYLLYRSFRVTEELVLDKARKAVRYEYSTPLDQIEWTCDFKELRAVKLTWIEPLARRARGHWQLYGFLLVLKDGNEIPIYKATKGMRNARAKEAREFAETVSRFLGVEMQFPEDIGIGSSV